ncbi:GNAT family N-acetyltransferase [Zavarzinia sp. CC-PAN008]|uniref:GNAT family N-acetyltransferase n=1 Tax=Zavarzinia sp. CC-PAN008 TaxID=3243332 RepID=UPI003F74A788
MTKAPAPGRNIDGLAASDAALGLGYHALAPGHIANVVTCLEMREPPPARPGRGFAAPFALVALPQPDVDEYLALYRKVGADWLWYSRLAMPRPDLAAILHHPAVEVFALENAGERVGILELDFRQAGQCELAFFGLAAGAIGAGLGRSLMDAAIARAWAAPIDRFWVHTCTLDHPSAIGFYQRSGFRPYAVMVEVTPDPRLDGLLPRDAAAHVPLLPA